MASLRAFLVSCSCFLALALVALPAHAWTEVHVESDDARLTFDRGGGARVEHRLRVRITGSPLRAFDLRGVDPEAVPDAEGCFAAPSKEVAGAHPNDPPSLAGATTATAELMPPEKPNADGSPALRTLRLRFDEGLKRGVYVLFIRYRADLAAHVTPADALARIVWTGPVFDDGFDSARVTFELPGAVTPPRADDATPDDGTIAPLVLSNVRRDAGHDDIELVRPYAPRGEAVRWSILADLHAIANPALKPPDARPAPPTVSGGLQDPAHRAIALGAAAALFLFYASLVALKSREVDRLARAVETKARPLLPMPIFVRAILAGASLVAGLALELVFLRGTLGAAAVVLATALASHRTPRWPKPQRGPGKWLPVAEREAFRDPTRPRALLDASTRAGKVVFTSLLAALGAGVALLFPISPYHAVLVALDATALLAVFGTGRASELPPDPAAAPAPFFRDVVKRVRSLVRGEELRVVGKLRIPAGSPDADELRLAIAPKTPLQGFSSIEIGVVYVRGAGGALALPEVLLRVVEGSPCDRAVTKLSKRGRSSRGKKNNERVVAFSPRVPTARLTAGIAAALVRAVTDRALVERATKPARKAA